MQTFSGLRLLAQADDATGLATSPQHAAFYTGTATGRRSWTMRVTPLRALNPSAGAPYPRSGQILRSVVESAHAIQ